MAMPNPGISLPLLPFTSYPMADPLSITLAAITLATALKDVINLAQKLNDSFKKPALNMQRAESLAEETLKIVYVLNKFYDRHSKILDDDPDLLGALKDLLADMTLVYEKCHPILNAPNSSKSKIHKFKYSINAWINRKDVEKDICSLKDKAKSCCAQFMLLTQLGTATGVIQLKSAVAQGFSTIQRHQSPLRVPDDNVLGFLGSTPTILSNLPPHVKLSEHLVYRSYITLQVGKINALFETLASSGFYPVEEPDSRHLQPFRSVIWLSPSTAEEVEYVQSEVFTLFVKIQESLRSRHNGLSIQQGAHAMSNLSVWLLKLGMFQESLTIGKCSVDLYRTLIKTKEDVYAPYLAHALCQLSSSYLGTGDLVDAYRSIAEAVTLGRRLVAANSTFDAQMQLADLLSFSAWTGRLNGDRENALRDAEEAVKSLERLLGRPTTVMRAEASVIDWKAGPTVTTYEGTCMFRFADALQELHHSLSSTTRKQESVNAGIEALEIYRALDQRDSDNACPLEVNSLSTRIGTIYFSLTSEEFRGIIPYDQALSYARQSVRYYEKVLQNTGEISRELLTALVGEAVLLSRLEIFDEAYSVCQKIEQIVQNHVNDQELRVETLLQLLKTLWTSKRPAETALAGEKLLSIYRSSLSHSGLSMAYNYTSAALAEVGDHVKSVQIAEESVDHWRMVVSQGFQSTGYFNVASSLSELAERLFRWENYERAFEEGDKVMKLCSSLITEFPVLLGEYIHALKLNSGIAYYTEMEFKSVQRSREVLQCCRGLVKQFPDQQMFLLCSIRDHAKVLENFNYLEEADTAVKEVLSWFNGNPAKQPDSAKLHIDCLLRSGRFLLGRGSPQKASNFWDEAIRIGLAFVDTHSVALHILSAKLYRVLGLYYMGQTSIALDEIEDCLKFASEQSLEKAGAYTWGLEMVALMYRCSGRVGKALPIIRQSIDLDRKYNRNPASWVLSDLLADSGEEGLALDVAREAMQETETKKSLPVLKAVHANVQYSLALRLFAVGELSQAQELLVQVRLFYQQYCKTKNIWFINLAITLRAEAVLGCLSNRHEEGVAARTELDDLRKHLRLVFPGLADFVEIGLSRERNFAIWKNLLKKFDLSCGHQNEEKISVEDDVDPQSESSQTQCWTD